METGRDMKGKGTRRGKGKGTKREGKGNYKGGFASAN